MDDTRLPAVSLRGVGCMLLGLLAIGQFSPKNELNKISSVGKFTEILILNEKQSLIYRNTIYRNLENTSIL